MSATEEQMAMLASAHVSHVSYVLILYSLSFLLFFLVAQLLHLYCASAFPITQSKATDGITAEGRDTGYADSRARDAEEFELEGLISEDEEGIEDKPHSREEQRPNGR